MVAPRPLWSRGYIWPNQSPGRLTIKSGINASNFSIQTNKKRYLDISSFILFILLIGDPATLSPVIGAPRVMSQPVTPGGDSG